MDYPYIILLLLLFLLAFLEWYRPSRSNRYFKIASAIVFAFIAFRAPVVGADTWNYYRFATGIRNFYNYDSRAPEPLYLLYNEFFRRFCRVGVIFMMVNTLLIFSPICYILKKYTKYKTFGILSFFLFIDYSVFFVALRQMLALSIILWGVIYVMEDRKQKWLTFIVLSVVAWFMHTTVAVVTPLFILAYCIPIRNRFITIGIIIVSAIVGVVLQSFNILQAFDFYLTLNYGGTERLTNYFENQELNDLATLNITLRATILGVITFLFIDKEKINHWFSKIYLIGIFLFNLFISAPMIQRMVVANMLFIIFVLPWVFESRKYINTLKTRQLVNIIMLLLVMYFSRSYIINNTDYGLESTQRMHPYYFFFQDYHDHPSIKYFN